MPRETSARHDRGQKPRKPANARTEDDISDAFWMSLFGCLASLGAAYLGYLNRLRSGRIEQNVAAVHEATNGLTERLARSARQAGYAEGYAEGRAAGRLAAEDAEVRRAAPAPPTPPAPPA